ncbi:CRISPR system Cascade subunit CasC [Azospirillaceae bacterium]
MTATPRFLQIHTLTPYVGALLNRDDVGMAKRLPFGGSERIRISSQCLKRHWRLWDGDWSLGALGGPDPLAVRSREIFNREIAPVLAAEGFDPAEIVATLTALRDALQGNSGKTEKTDEIKNEKSTGKKEKEDKKAPSEYPFDKLKLEQVIVLGRQEIEFITTMALTLLRKSESDNDLKNGINSYLNTSKSDIKKNSLYKEREAYLKANKGNLKAMKRAAGLDGALFGRMVTSDIPARRRGACGSCVHGSPRRGRTGLFHGGG